VSDFGFNEQGLVIAGELMMEWDEIDQRRNRFRFANSVLVKVSFAYGRVSNIEDAEIYDRDEWAKIKKALDGLGASFCDFAGKHSEVYLDFWDGVDLEEITDIDEIIAFNKVHGMSQLDLGIVSEAIFQCQENDELDDDLNRIG